MFKQVFANAQHRVMLILLCILMLQPAFPAIAQQSVARIWNEELLFAIRRDNARPTVHARNLFHLSIAMWDAWATYNPFAPNYLFTEKRIAANKELARDETLSFAAYRLLRYRFANSPGMSQSYIEFDLRMDELGYNKTNTSTTGNSPAAVGNRIAAAVIAFGQTDGSNEQANYATLPAQFPTVNEVMIVAFPGTIMNDPNRWQPLAVEFYIGQFGNPIAIFSPKQTPFWGNVVPFGLTDLDRTPNTHFDPGAPPLLGGVGDAEFRDAVVQIIEFSSYLDPDDGVFIDTSPAVEGNRPLGSYTGTGHAINPNTGLPYPPNLVKRGDWARVLAEFWADGPDSETPPGHWNTIANYVVDQPTFERRMAGAGPVLPDLEFDVKMYLVLNGAVHDAAVAAWGAKGFYDSCRPISAIRYMAGLGQSTEPAAPDYDPLGLPLIPGLIERISAESSAPGERHEELADFVGELALLAWPGSPGDMVNAHSGVKWIRALRWLPYQDPASVTPNFPGYVADHSAFSRAAAEVLTSLTGDPYFPGGLGVFYATQNQFLKVEDGPTEDVYLQWATYYDAADESGVSSLYGGIHPNFDDIPGRIIGSQIGIRAWATTQPYFSVTEADLPSIHSADSNGNNSISLTELLRVIQLYNFGAYSCQEGTEDGFVPGGNGTFTCVPHSSDYNAFDWSIGFTELLRVIQLYNALAYHPCATVGEDGFCAGLA